MTRQEARKAILRAALGTVGLAAGAASTILFPPAALPICVSAGIVLFILGWRSALRVAQVDELVFSHPPIWRPPNPPIPMSPVRPSVARRSGLTLVGGHPGSVSASDIGSGRAEPQHQRPEPQHQRP